VHISKHYTLGFFCLLPLIITQILITLPKCQADEPVFQSKHCTIRYDDPDQLENFARKIRPSAINRTLNQLFLGKTSQSDETKLGEFLDELFKRVQLVLDMPMPKLNVEIKIHRDINEVHTMYTQLTGRSSDAPSFYWKKTNTIHIQSDSLTIGMLAHEMGHAILDHYFAIQPPEKIAEMLCQYVDKEITSGHF